MSIIQAVYLRVRSDIIFGKLPPGASLDLQRLEANYDAPESVLREVLARLATERFVVSSEAQRGFATAEVSAENLLEIADLRKVIELDAMAKSFKNGGKAWEDDVATAHQKLVRLENLVKDGMTTERSDWRRHDFGFHQTLIKGCNSMELLSVYTTVMDKYLRYQMLFLTFRGDIAAAEHRELKDAALARDIGRAQAALIRHIDGGVAHALEAHSLGRYRTA